MQKSLVTLFHSIADVIDDGEAGNDAVAAVAVADPSVDDAFAPLAPDTGMSNVAIEDGIIDLVENGEYTYRTATTLAEKLDVDVAKVKTVAEDSSELFIYTKGATDETLIRLS